jgi:hypothetical protein
MSINTLKSTVRPEWYHWICLGKDIYRYSFFDFLISVLNI